MMTLITHEEFEAMLTELQSDTATATEHYIQCYAAATNEVKRWEAESARAKDLIGEIMMETGATKLESNSGSATVTKPILLISYDREKLDELCEDDDDLAVKLQPFRKVKEVAGHLRITPRMKR